MGLDRAPIEFQTFYFSHVLVVPPNVYFHACIYIFAYTFVYLHLDLEFGKWMGGS